LGQSARSATAYTFTKQMLAAATKGQQPAAQATEAPAAAPSTADSASAGPMGPGHGSGPDAG
jgi:hypothetical protein